MPWSVSTGIPSFDCRYLSAASHRRRYTFPFWARSPASWADHISSAPLLGTRLAEHHERVQLSITKRCTGAELASSRRPASTIATRPLRVARYRQVTPERAFGEAPLE